MWSYIFTAVVGFSLYSISSSISKRFEKIEDERGPGFSTSFNVNVMEAIMSHPKFGELTGIKSAGKPYKDWSKADNELWHKKYREKLGNRAYVHFHYLVGENVYFVSTNNNGSNLSGLVKRDGTTNLLYSSIVAGDEDGFEPNLEFSVYERLIKFADGNRAWVLSPCLKYKEGTFEDEDFKILFDYPLHRLDMDDDKFKNLGFKIDRFGGDDIYTDDFGETHGLPGFMKLKKNGAEISFSF